MGCFSEQTFLSWSRSRIHGSALANVHKFLTMRNLWGDAIVYLTTHLDMIMQCVGDIHVESLVRIRVL